MGDLIDSMNTFMVGTSDSCPSLGNHPTKRNREFFSFSFFFFFELRQKLFSAAAQHSKEKKSGDRTQRGPAAIDQEKIPTLAHRPGPTVFPHGSSGHIHRHRKCAHRLQTLPHDATSDPPHLPQDTAKLTIEISARHIFFFFFFFTTSGGVEKLPLTSPQYP